MKLEKQGSLLPGDKPGPFSVPLAITSLSPMRIAAMSESELRTVLPELVAILQQGEMSRKPDWWPHSTIPWTPHCISTAIKSANPACLRGLVTQCYSYLTQHSVQLNPGQPRIPPQPRVLDWLNSHPPSRSCVQPVKNCGMSSTKRKLKDGVPYLDIHRCYHCNKEFPAPDTLHKHQVHCSGGSLVMSVPSTPPASDSPSPTPPTTASDDTSVSGATLSQPQSSSSSSSTPCQLSFSKFVAALDMVPVHRARKILKARRRNTECETIDLEEPKTPISPPTPRTPKLLISLLSRDGGASSSSGGSGSHGASSRRRLSYLRQSVDRLEDKGKEGGKSGSDEESSDSGADDADEPKLHKKSLFSIDVTSGLGQRVLRHMRLEGHMPVVLDCEQFCRTPIKDKYQDRLRTRQLSYPVTWKCTGKRQRQQTHYHLYNFTRAQTFEFMEKMRTGLNWRCRKLLRCIRKSSVVVKRLSAKTLRKWKPSLNKLSVPLKRLTEKEISMWTRPKVVRDHPGLSQYLTVLAIRVDHALKRKDGAPYSKPQCTKKASSRNVFNGPFKSSRATTGQDLNRGSSGRSKVQESLPVEKTPSSASGIIDSPGGFKSPRDRWLGAEVKTPLKIDIPSVSGLMASARGTKNSPLDDSFSVMTVSSSDEENSRKGECCALCTTRNRVLSPSQRLALPAAIRRCSHSPASTSSVGSSVPPDMSSPASSLAGSLSPLSPPSLSARSSSQSWASAVKCGGCGPYCESHSCFSSSASMSGTGQDLPEGSPTACTRTGSSSARKDSRTPLMQNGVVSKGSENPTHAKTGASKSRNCSVVGDSKKVDVAVSSAAKLVCVSRSRDRKVTPQGGTRAVWTSVSRQTAKTRSMGQQTRDSPAAHCRQQTTVLDRRGASPERTQREWKSESRSDSGNTDESCERSPDKAWVDPDGAEWGLCNGSGGHKGQLQEEHVSTAMPRTGILNKSMDCISDMAPSSPDRTEDAHCQKKVLRVEVEEEGVDLKYGGDDKCQTWVDGHGPDSMGSCAHAVMGSNPFLLSQTQTPFSAHRHWTLPQTSSPGENDAENTFQSGNVKSSSVTSAPVNSDSSAGIGPAPPLISHHSHSSHKLLQVSQCSPSKTDSPFQTQKEISPPARKLLSALQMLSVLESARSKTSPCKSRGPGESSGKRKKNKNRCNLGMGLEMTVSAKVGYQTRSQEPLFGARPRKTVDRLQGVDFKRGSKQTLSAIQF